MLVGSFIPQNDLSELGKLPQLLAHYRFHHSVVGGLSLSQFLADHYGAGTKEHFGCTFSPQHQQDLQGLPPHGRHTCTSHAAFLLVVPTPLVRQQPLLAAVRAYRAAPHARATSEEPSPALLQPPRA